ncbi:MAG: DUF4412 domain-containing protein [Chlorobium phaeobacteroides]|uniref:DUF4412 domain-containing protein n=1 Tax=Chlorobium phaeobacteroides (strain BS1) TaxID=331678 RepID=B3EPC3_CHLPB|nr:DUF4412 domain-containing protein [Chlorobium phaeobacteroides]NEX13170.1 DUF4412 domain-containing protein [Prosthecochloris sp.]
MNKLFCTALMTLMFCSLYPFTASARFTGIIDMNLTMPNGKSGVTYFFGSDEQRMDMTTQLDKIPDPLKTTVITRASDPDQATILNHKAATYTKVNLKTAAENATLVDFDSDYRIEKAGKETIKGYSCRHVKLFSATDTIEMWLTRDIGDFETFRLLQSQNPRLSNTVLAKKLSDEGLDGFPVRIIQKNEAGTLAMEVISVTPMPVKPSEFSIPQGYTEIADPQQPLNQQQKQHLKDLMEKIKNFNE